MINCHSKRSDGKKTTLWEEAKNALVNLAVKAAEYDEDGIDIRFLNSEKFGRRLKTKEAVEKVFSGVSPKRGTPIATRLDSVIRDYIADYRQWKRPSSVLSRIKPKKPLKKLNVVVITDGYPSDEPKPVIADLVRDMEQLGMEYNRVGIQFVQIGDDENARRYLEELDDDKRLNGTGLDIIDTTQYTGIPLDKDPETSVKILLGGVHRKIDVEGAPAAMYQGDGRRRYRKEKK